MNTTVMTVRGELPIEKIGFALMHEHLLSAGPGVAHAYPQLINDGYPSRTGIGYENRILRMLYAASEVGVETILDVTPFDLGRDARMLKWMSEQSGINIIAATGWYKEQKPVVACLAKYTPERFAEIFIDDLVRGMEGTDIRAGVIKTACEPDGMTDQRRVIHLACAIAAKETGAPVVLHQDFGDRTAYDQIKIMRDEGVDMNRVKVDHVLDGEDDAYVSWIMDQGVWIGADRLPTWRIPGLLPNEARIKALKHLIDLGFGNRILLGHDSACISMGADAFEPDENGLNGAANPYGLCGLKQYTIPKLLDLGVDADVIHKIVYENPKEFFRGR